jgi:parallel beta-helix repeat protein
LNFDWCSGSGTWNDPYLIENVYIDGLNTTSCIRIQDSQAYFVIRNCTLINAADGDFGIMFAGIHLLSSSNGRIHNNTCSFNNQAGIIAERSINNSIWDCIANDNKDYGIALYWDSGIGSNNNTVRECTTNNNREYGIHVYASNYARIIQNTINNSRRNGIDIQGITHNHTIIGNTISFAGDDGISVGNVNDCKIIGNRITDCEQSGMKCFSCSNSLISDNNLTANYWTSLSVSDGKFNKFFIILSRIPILAFILIT